MKDYIEFLKTLHDCSFISDDGYAKVMEDPRFQGWLKQEKKKTPSAEERQGEYDSSKCQARIWADGYDQVQCSFLPHNGTCFCKRHSGSDWWLVRSQIQNLKNQYCIQRSILKVLNISGRMIVNILKKQQNMKKRKKDQKGVEDQKVLKTRRRKKLERNLICPSKKFKHSLKKKNKKKNKNKNNKRHHILFYNFLCKIY